MKQKTPEQELELLRENLLHERVIWERINENGCNDPFWADGCNMNLTRNHILSYRNEIANCCEEHNLPLPEEYFLKVPPEVDDDYMASFNQKARVNRLKQQGNILSRKKKKFIDDGQMEMCIRDSYWPTKWRLNQKIKEEFDANGIVIPYNQMEVYVHQQK